MIKTKKSDIENIYHVEYEVLEKAKKVAGDYKSNGNLLLVNYTELIEEYEKLLNNTIKINSISDSQHLSLLEVQEKLINMNKELEHISVTDKLTNIYNRFKFDEIMASEINRFNRYGRKFSVIIVDIDYFKRINDTYGHIFGDKILTAFAGLLKQNIRNTDVISRWGGEEFFILLPETQMDEALITAEYLRSLVEKEYFLSKIRITASFGVAEYSKDMTTDAFIEEADEGLYFAKENGRNRVGCKNDFKN